MGDRYPDRIVTQRELSEAGDLIDVLREKGMSEHGPVPLIVRRLGRLNIDNGTIGAVLRVVMDTCQDCWDGDTRCACERDE